jgi:2-keto-4-pentenoate hydratase/2-oxohepta-3-ene-1,7-dioic acid hydratase in catechol pathway
MDTFGPIGPWLVTADEMPWPLAGRIECRVNGDLRQQGDAKDMLFPPDRIIAFISRYITLSPGDVIALGTPEGVGPLAPGDVVEVFVEGVGLLRNPVARAEG